MRCPRPLSLLLPVLVLASLNSCSQEGPAPVRLAASSEMDPDVLQVLEQRIAQVELDRNNAQAHRSLALAYEANTAWAEAELSYANALKLEPDDALARLHRAICLEEAGRMEESFQLLEEAVEGRPDSLPCRWRYGLALLLRDRLEDAEEQFRLVATRLPNAPHGLLGQGQVALARGDASRASELLLEALSRSPGDAYVSFALGMAYRELGRDAEAARLLTHGAGAARPGIPDELSDEISRYTRSRASRIALALSMLEKNELQGAQELLERLREQYPDDEAIVGNLCVALMRQSRFEEALEVIANLLAINPEQHAAYVNRSSCLLSLGQLADEAGDAGMARQHWADSMAASTEAVRLAPHIAKTHLGRAQVLMRLSMYDDAILEIRETLRLGHRNEDIYLNLAKLVLGLEGRAPAIEVLEEARAENATFLQVRYNLIDAYSQSDQAQQARSILDELMVAAPRNPLTEQARLLLEGRGM